MSDDMIRLASLLIATITMGLATGVFCLYAHTIMPGLRRTDDRTFVASFQAIDRAILNAWFLGGTFIAPVVASAVAVLAGWDEPGFAWILGALAAYVSVVAITVVVNVPVNDALKAAGEPDAIDVHGARAAFDEGRWARWNLVRAVLSVGAFAALAWALVLTGEGRG